MEEYNWAGGPNEDPHAGLTQIGGRYLKPLIYGGDAYADLPYDEQIRRSMQYHPAAQLLYQSATRGPDNRLYVDPAAEGATMGAIRGSDWGSNLSNFLGNYGPALASVAFGGLMGAHAATTGAGTAAASEGAASGGAGGLPWDYASEVPVAEGVSAGASSGAPVVDITTGTGGSPAPVVEAGQQAGFADRLRYLASQVMGSAGAGAGGGSFGTLNTAWNLGSGIYGLARQAQTRKLGAAGRPSAEQLAYLTNNPAAIRGVPGYQAGLEAGRQELERYLAQQGQTGGGLAAQAMARFGGQYDTMFRQAELNRLQSVAQGAVPAEREANDIVRRALEQISYTFRRM